MKSSITQLIGICLFLFITLSFQKANAGLGDTTMVQTFRYDTTMRAGMFMFPNDSTKTYEKIVMLYSMRCKDGLVSYINSSNPPDPVTRNLGCGEWDYNCYTYVTDSSQTDSLRTFQKSYVISNTADTIFNYTAVPVWSYYQTSQQEITHSDTISEVTATAGAGSNSLADPFNTSAMLSKTQYLWTAAELSAAGLTAGNITSLRLDILSLGSAVDNLRIRIKHTAQTVLNAGSPELSGFTEVYYLNTSLAITGIQEFKFFAPFNWNGTSNIIIEFSYSNASPGSDNTVSGHNVGFNAALINTQPDAYLNFNGSISCLKVNPALYDSISAEITVAFWVYGDAAKLPAQTSMFEAYDALNRRQLNLHLPWSDGSIYWDCGNDGTGYDRINKAATVAEYEGQWNFWAVTKNATTGVMNIYLNGNLWHTGTGKTKLIDISNMIVGRGITTYLYQGSLDEFSIWNKAMDLASVQQIMYSDITSSHPDYANLLCYYKLNEDAGNIAYDASPNAFNSDITNPAWRHQRGNTLFRNFSVSTNKPNTTFVKGVYTSTVQSNPVLDSVMNNPTSVISYSVTGTDLNIIDTTYVWPAGYAYIFDPAGVKIDSVAIASQNTLTVTQLLYYRKRPMRVELLNFITPYGIYLDLDGLNGKTWQIDVTDYAPVLKGMKYMAMEDGKYQEENDIKFLFIEGTPPRNVKSISQVWPSGSWVSPSYNDIVNNVYFEQRNLTLSPAGAGFKVRSSISGHGQEGEFIPRVHTINLNGTRNFPATVWRECSTNPIYPQGGTWVYDRAGWCPGAAVDIRDYELTNYVSPGQNITLDYSLPFITNPGSSSYRVNNQLVSYGAPNFARNAGVNYIKSPSMRTEFTRVNPLCNAPIISIINQGSDTLTSLDITYGRVNSPMSSYHWTGSLSFLSSVEITLPSPDWIGSSNEFIVVLSNPNSGSDQYTHNDTLISAFNYPAMMPADLIFELFTNDYGYENAYTLKDASGVNVINRTSLANTTWYEDTVHLATGCYQVYLTDLGGFNDGLDWWANPNQGSGYFRIKNITGTVLKTYDPDFGHNIFEQFTVNYNLPVNEAPGGKIESLQVYPNPAAAMFTVEFSSQLNSIATMKLTNVIGEVIRKENIQVTSPTQKFKMSLSGVDNGVYFVTVESGESKKIAKLVVAH